MQFLPCTMFCQNSSRFLACGNWPDMPITAMGCLEGATSRSGTLWNRASLRRRHEVSFSPASLVAIFGCDEGPFVDADCAEGVLGLGSVPCFSASCLT